MKAPMVTPTGCPCCGSGGMPGTACAVCTRHAHGVAVRRRNHELRFGREPARARVQATEDARAAWVGADLLLDTLGVLLVRVGFELPDVVEVR